MEQSLIVASGSVTSCCPVRMPQAPPWLATWSWGTKSGTASHAVLSEETRRYLVPVQYVFPDASVKYVLLRGRYEVRNVLVSLTLTLRSGPSSGVLQ